MQPNNDAGARTPDQAVRESLTYQIVREDITFEQNMVPGLVDTHQHGAIQFVPFREELEDPAGFHCFSTGYSPRC